MIDFVYFGIEVGTTKDDAISPATGKKVLDFASKLGFLNQFSPTSIQRRDAETLSIETKYNVDVSLHPNGSFHFESMAPTIKTLGTIERWTSKIAGLYKKYNPKIPQFDVSFQSHTDPKSKDQLTRISRIFTSLRTSPPLSHTQQESTPTYLVTRVKPTALSKSMFISYHPEYVDLNFALKPLTPSQMKNRFLITPAEALISVLTKEIGEG